MTKTTIAREVRLKNWASEAQDFWDSGLSLAAWCTIHEIPPSTFRYRLQAIKKEMETRTVTPISTGEPELPAIPLVEIPREVRAEPLPGCSTCTTRILFGNTSIELSADAPVDHLSIILEVIARAQ